MVKKRLLMVLGPTQIEEEILKKGATPQMYNRTGEFSKILERVNRNLQYLFQTKNPVFLLTCSGTGAMEAAVLNTLSKGDEVLAVNGGTFGRRWTEICKKHGVKVKEIKLKYGQPVDPKDIERELSRNRNIKAVLTTLNETSTGVLTDIKSIGAIVNSYPAILVVDGVSGVGVEEMPMDAWHCDVLLTSSQKAMALPPGLAFISFSKKALRLAEKAGLKTFYFDVFEYQKNWERNQTAFTPAIALIYQLDPRLQKIRKEGLASYRRKYARLTEMLRRGIKAIGLNTAGEKLSNCVTGIWSPDGIDASKVVERMQNNYHIYIAPSPGDLKTRLFRIGNFGDIKEKDISRMLSALKNTLSYFGFRAKPGSKAY